MRKKVIKDAIKFMLPTIIIGIILESLTNILSIITSTIIGDFTNSILNNSANIAIENIIVLVLCLGITILIIPALSGIDNSIMLKNALVHDRHIYKKFFMKDYLKAKIYDPGEVYSRLEMDPIELRWRVIASISYPITIIITSIVLGYFLFSKSIVYGFVAIGASLLPIIVTLMTRNIATRYEMKTREYGDKKWALERELYDNFSYIKFYKIPKIIIKGLDDLFIEYYHKVLIKDIRCKSVVSFFNNILKASSKIIVVLFGAYLVSKGEITVGLIASFIGYMASIENLVGQIKELLNEAPLVNKSADRLIEFYTHRDIKGKEIISNIEKITINNLSFGYDENKKLWNNVLLEINEGDKVVIAGHNGTGKSTFIKCLCGLYSGYKGDILINGVNLENIDINWWRDSIAYIEQDQSLFEGTIKENILLGNLEASQEVVEEVMKKVNLDVPLHTKIVNGGNNLSGGQKQKISIARALIKNAPIIILDEPLNNLDIETQGIIHNIIERGTETIIYISHDNKTRELANKVYNFVK